MVRLILGYDGLGIPLVTCPYSGLRCELHVDIKWGRPADVGHGWVPLGGFVHGGSDTSESLSNHLFSFSCFILWSTGRLSH